MDLCAGNMMQALAFKYGYMRKEIPDILSHNYQVLSFDKNNSSVLSSCDKFKLMHLYISDISFENFNNYFQNATVVIQNSNMNFMHKINIEKVKIINDIFIVDLDTGLDFEYIYGATKKISSSQQVSIHLKTNNHYININYCAKILVRIYYYNYYYHKNKNISNIEICYKRNGEKERLIEHHTKNDFLKQNKKINNEELENCDGILMKNIIFRNDNNLNIDDFKKSIKDVILKFMIKDEIIQNYHLNFLTKFNKIEQKDNFFVVNIPDFFMKHINIKNINGCNISIMNSTNNLLNFEIGIEKIFYDEPYENKKISIQQLSKNILSIKMDSIEKQIVSYNIQPSKGFFIAGKYKNIKLLKTTMCGHINRYLNSTDILVLGNQISDELIYIPYNNASYDDIRLSSYIGCVNTAGVDSYKFMFEFYEIIDESIEIYELNNNICEIINNELILKQKETEHIGL